MKIRHTNSVDFWTITQSNSLGFLDREPVSSERAAESCHIAVIGDSFVDAREVSISDKLQTRLEELAVRERSDLDVTTSAFGISGTHQITQLPFYDEFARQMSPKIVVLVFVHNDLYVKIPSNVKRGEDGYLKLQFPDPDYGVSGSTTGLFPKPWRVLKKIARMSYFAHWLHTKIWWGRRMRLREIHEKEDLPAGRQSDLDGVAFGLDRFKERTARDGASLVILSTHTMGTEGNPEFDRLSVMAEARGIPVIDQYDYILRQGGRIEDAHWPHDRHWSPTGHRWAAEALLEHLKLHPETCDGAASGGTYRDTR